jgi:uncharacterized protein (DUF1778 family)
MKRATSAGTRVETKSERLELRVTPSAKRVIQQAAPVNGLSAADLAYEGARRVLTEHEHMELAEADRRVFLRAVLSPAEAIWATHHRSEAPRRRSRMTDAAVPSADQDRTPLRAP